MTTFRYIAETKIALVEERFVKRYVSGRALEASSGDAVTELVSTGWWIITEAPEPSAFCVGAAKPPHSPGDIVRLTYELESKNPND